MVWLQRASKRAKNPAELEKLRRLMERHNSHTSNTSNASNVSEKVAVNAQDDLDYEWELDDAQTDAAGGYISQGPVDEKSEETLLDKFFRNNRWEHGETGFLRLPVVLPQRRPGERSRGFVKAYAPELLNAGIDQDTWLSFLDVLTKATMADPRLNAINLAAIGTMFMPHVVGFIVSYAINQAANIAIQVQARNRYDSWHSIAEHH